MNTSLVRNATRREGKLQSCCCSLLTTRSGTNTTGSIQCALRKREKEVETFGVTFDITTKDEISATVCTARRRPRRRRPTLVGIHPSVSRERESERVSKHIHIHRDAKCTQSAREDDVTKRRERTSGMNERATCVENEMLRTFMISHSSSETRTLTSFFSPLLGRCISSFRMLLL